jgi:hypothetical protein
MLRPRLSTERNNLTLGQTDDVLLDERPGSDIGTIRLHAPHAVAVTDVKQSAIFLLEDFEEFAVLGGA